MQLKTQLVLVALLATFQPRFAAAVSPTADEMTAARQWTAAHFKSGPEMKSAPPLFSFTYDGKPWADLLKTWDCKRTDNKLDDRRTQETFTWTDPKTGLEVRCTAVEYSDFPVVEWTAHFKNTGKADTPILENIQALNTRWERPDGGEFVLRGIKGDACTADSYEPYETVLGPNAAQKFAPGGGRPTNGAFPYYNLAMPGGGLIVVVGWPGQWATSFARDAAKGIQVTAGQELTHLRLKPGEEIRTPLVALMFWKGADAQRAQNLWRRWMMAHNIHKPGGKPMQPALMMCTSDFYPGMKSNAAEEIKYAETYLKAGIKINYWWVDAGWYPCTEWWNVGTWQPDPQRYPKGIKELSDYVHSKGLKLVVWFEPERVTANSWLAKNHPEWLFSGQKAGTDQNLLNLGNPEARRWLTDHIDRMLTEQGIDLYRQDFNMDPLNHWRSTDAPDRQGISENLHVQGYLAYWDELQRRHPNMPIDSCASGGRRIDLETLRRAVPLLRSDYRFEPLFTQQCHTYGLSMWVPYYGTGVFDKDDYTVRSFWCPWMGIGEPAPRQPGLDWTKCRRMIDNWCKAGGYMLGDYYPLLPYSLNDTVWIAWQFDCPEKGEGMIQAFRRAQSPYESIRVKLHGLEPGAVYTLTNLDVPGATEISGRELLEKGLSIGMNAQPSSTVIIYKKKP
jgi:alpha-galactosidase